ncbi:MAG: hypothetical protein AAFP19_01610 [Bacteroidota bacterium]
MNFRTRHQLLSLFFLAFAFVLNAQESVSQADSTGLPGDHFSLEGALELFKKAESPEDFEKLLNQEDNYVNNLDLNEDGAIDYIRVIDNMDGEVHALVLQVPFSEEESQDIAVIEIEKQSENEAILQIVGDVDIYGEQVIVEPFEEQGQSEGKGPSAEWEIVRIVVNVWAWPSVRFIYGPRYRLYVSPYRWGVYPRWWNPWRPHPWRWHYSRRAFYRPRYRVVTTHRVVRAHRVYTPVRRTTRVVHTRTTTRVAVNRKSNAAVRKTNTTAVKRKTPNGTVTKTTRTTTRGKARNGNKAAKTKTTRTTTVKKKNGKAAGRKKTTVKRSRRKN